MNKVGFRKCWGLLLAVILVTVMTAGCEQGESAEKPESVPDGTKETEEKAVSNPKGHAVGEEIKLSDWINLTVTNVERSDGNELSKPRNGNEYIIVSVKLENIGDDNFQYESYSFSLVNSVGGDINEDTTTTVDVGTYLQKGELKPGETITGTIAFQQPIGEQGLQVKFQSRYADMPTARIDIP